MDKKEIQGIFEAYFEKFKKTEGDRTLWSAFRADHTSSGVLEIIMSRCPKGLSFKFFIDKKKVAEVWGWDDFFSQADDLNGIRADIYDAHRFFDGMKMMI